MSKTIIAKCSISAYAAMLGNCFGPTMQIPNYKDLIITSFFWSKPKIKNRENGSLISPYDSKRNML